MLMVKFNKLILRCKWSQFYNYTHYSKVTKFNYKNNNVVLKI